MERIYEPTSLTLVQMPDGNYSTEFIVAVESDEGIVQGGTSFEGSTRIQRWDVSSSGSGGAISCTSLPFARQEGEDTVMVEVYKGGVKKGEVKGQYPD